MRAGLLDDRMTLFRDDLFAQSDFKNPHPLLVSTNNSNPMVVNVALQAQTQAALFFLSDGMITPDPDGAGVLFEVPPSAVPTDFGFIP